MMKTARCLLAVFLLIVFGGGTVWAAQQGDGLIQAAVESPVDQSMPDGCDNCSGSDMPMTATACSALGTCMQAIDSFATDALPELESVVYPIVADHLTGFKGFPEPFPPKNHILA